MLLFSSCKRSMLHEILHVVLFACPSHTFTKLITYVLSGSETNPSQTEGGGIISNVAHKMEVDASAR